MYQPYKWIFYFPFFALNTLALSLLASMLSGFISHRFIGRMAALWARMNVFLTPAVINVTGRENIQPGQSYVVVANHQSYYDIPALYGWLGIDFRWVMKHELRKVPGLGIFSERIGHIFVDRRNREAAMASIFAAREKISGGTSVVFFPEGSIFGHGSLGPFKRGAYVFAMDMGLPLLPVTISGTEDILPYKSLDLFPGRVSIAIHSPIEMKGQGSEAMERAIKESWEVIMSGLKKKTENIPQE